MISTLFFDEVDASSALHVRTTRQHHIDESSVQGSVTAFTKSYGKDTFCSGSIPVPSLRATLLWWLDRDAPLVRILLTSNNSPGDVSYSCRKMTLEIPAPRESIIACGVTHVREETIFALTWVTSMLEVGLLRVQLQRSSDQHSHLLLVPDGKTVLTSRLSQVATSFESETGSPTSRNGNTGRENETDESIGVSVSACILASIAPEKVTDGVLSVIALTNGISIWRVEVVEDGTFTEEEFRDLKSQNGGNKDSSRNSGISSWLPSWPWDGKQRKGCRYLSISAVQQTQYILLLRSNGSLELYDSSMRPVAPDSICVLSMENFSSCRVLYQWSTFLDDDVHVVTCFGGKEVCHCTWSRIPINANGGILPPAQSMSILPPVATSSPMGCVAVKSEQLAILWSAVAEEDGCVRSSLSVGSLLHSTQQGLSGFLQIITAKDEVEAEIRNKRVVSARLLLEKVDVFFCHSRPLHALTCVKDELVLIENSEEGVRAHVLSSEMSPLERLLESAFAVGRPVVPATRNALPLPSIHLVPAVVSEEVNHPLCTDTAAFDEGVELAASCADGADNLAALLISTVQSVPVALTLGGFQLLRSAAHLQGYAPSGFVDDTAMKTALKHASTNFKLYSRQNSFCSFSRRFVQHTISRDLLSRIAYIICSYIGWIGSRLGYSTSLELPRVRIILEFLSAAYHAVGVAGPFTATITPNVQETVIADVLELLLQFNTEDENDGNDVIFAVHVANRLRECDKALGMRACATWCNLLSRRYPCLQHFRIIRELDVGRTARSGQIRSMCLSASFHLSSLPANIAVPLILDSGLAVFNRGGTLRTAFDNVTVEEWQLLLTDTSLIAKVYRVALLRRVIYPSGTYHSSVDSTLVRELFLNELRELEQYVLFANGKDFTRLRRALIELRLETHMFLARASLDEPNFTDIFLSLEEVLNCADELDMSAMYTEQVMQVVGEVVELASSSQNFIEIIVSLAHTSAHLDSILTSKWYAYTARLTTKSASKQADLTRLRSAIGLYRYLCKRHAYGQAARMMTDLATVIRCSLFRAGAVEIVLELTALAVTAVELIAPTAPLQIQQEERDLSLYAAYGSPTSSRAPEQVVPPKGPLTREYLPWLRRRHYQAFCEKKLLEADRRVDCTDLWIEDTPMSTHAAAVKRFVEVLMESRFWTEARRFAEMAGYDVSVVLREHVLDLMMCTNYKTDEEALEEWYEMIEGCKEVSSPSNRFGPLRNTVIAALTYSYEKALPALLCALERLNRYEAMQALLEVFETLLHKRMLTMDSKRIKNEEIDDEPSLNAADSSDKNSSNMDKNNYICHDTVTAAQPWVPLVDSLRIGTTVLMDALYASERSDELCDASMTAGVFDPMACRARELLETPSLLEHPSLEQARSVAEAFLRAFEELKRNKLKMA
ncbi:putative dispersed gene family protein 1 (DGF-1) [Trypanosoma theileri]|uniref:Putative dispersed gene family protein 1 (DGF-1) n=1 Tax=Trypanosoma theileri TaxID=67003 RepID=A0A1X0P0J2_9TRYP|nr:putative dispersed gene family protein 1 (DGF-1) [Trypanosoma theileri]ORC90361.1 putative dispersed gene family protein 1 (DGF-1) [Trypanosoma theileri]